MLNKLILIVLLIVLSGCNKPGPEVVSKIDMGEVISVTYMEAGWGEWSKTKVKTNKAMMILRGHHTVMFGDAVTIREYSDGNNYACFSSKATCPKIYWN